MEERYVKKSIYKIELYLLKVIPVIIAGIYLLNSILSYFDINVIVCSIIGGMSILPLLFLYISSYVFRFCIYHRLPLYYILIVDIINYYDLYIGIPISNRSLVLLNIVLFGIMILLMLYLKFKVCKK